MDLDEMDDRQPRCGIPRGLNIAHLQRVGMKDADAIAEILRLTLRIEMDQRILAPHENQPPGSFGNRHQFGRDRPIRNRRSEEHTSELQSLMSIPYAHFCLKQN